MMVRYIKKGIHINKIGIISKNHNFCEKSFDFDANCDS